MTIHSGHPFLDPESSRDPVRRLRARLGGVVSLWTAGSDRAPSGLTVSSLMVAGGEPAYVLGLVDPDSDLLEDLGPAVVVSVRDEGVEVPPARPRLIGVERPGRTSC